MTSNTFPNASSPAAEEPTDVLSILIKILSDVGGVNADDIATDSRLVEDLAISSLNLIEAVVQVEDTFGVRVEDQHVQNFTTVGDIASFIDSSRADTAK